MDSRYEVSTERWCGLSRGAIMMSRLCFLSLLLVSLLRSAELARWSATQPAGSNGITLTVNRVHDYYRRSSILLRVDKPIQQSAWLELTYLDRGYGQISVAGARDQWGIARLNT